MAGQDEPGKQPGATPSAAEPGTSTFTQEQVEAAVNKARSDVLSEIGRLRKSSEEAVKTAQAATDRLDRMLKEQDDRELETASGDRQQLLAIQERQKRRAAESELVRVRQERDQQAEQLKQAEAERGERRRERTVTDVAERFKVDPVRLANMAKFTDGSPEAIEDAAKTLGENKTPLKPDSGGALGGSVPRAQIIAAWNKNPYDPAVRARYLELLRSEGRA